MLFSHTAEINLSQIIPLQRVGASELSTINHFLSTIFCSEHLKLLSHFIPHWGNLNTYKLENKHMEKFHCLYLSFFCEPLKTSSSFFDIYFLVVFFGHRKV